MWVTELSHLVSLDDDNGDDCKDDIKCTIFHDLNMNFQNIRQ